MFGEFWGFFLLEMCFVINILAYGFPYNFLVSKLSKLSVLCSCKVIIEHKCEKYWNDANCHCLIWPAHKGFIFIEEKPMVLYFVERS